MSESSPEVRASDADRDRVAKLLQEHFAQGRLDSDEFSTRLERAYKARVLGDLVPLTEDLPEHDLADLPADPPKPPPLGAAGVLRDPALAIPWAMWAGVNVLCFTIWLILFATGTTEGYPWFLWVLGPWGIVLGFITVALAATDRGGQGGPSGRP
ncbi:DUF1707 domain-containing protein [Streptomonospora nanhaiensis]|uniref:DUF1707 domain-containing protein n=1 Tax=Streptomonospora nanhaiensis TaxID=1323731 RepID=A0A853BNU7_9ACTN|nr:DUF1707 domain-containing protein [Streptomonospora nanhaiensis]MBV2361876.1 DUF1707 domain-containing protein [Streptomonospora nanhaiensis]MBX9389523.1 DUF1707 domain-containing protein [Streptomonospora nanhaiensis]NYI96306.1 hypothetical protein [Streptomonospora nanhaiensis]